MKMLNFQLMKFHMGLGTTVETVSTVADSEISP